MAGNVVGVGLLEHFKPHPKQLQFLLARARFCLALTGVGWGKSWALTLRVLMRAIENAPVPVALGGRTYRDLNDVLVPELLRHMDTIREATGVYLIDRWDRQGGHFHLLGGGRIMCRSYDRIDKVRGLNLGGACLDEVERAEADPDEVFGVFNERIRVPCSWPGLDIATTPNGLLGVTRKFYDARQRGDPDWHVTIGTSHDNPHLDPEFLRTLRSSMSDRRYKQEVGGQVLRPSHVVFPEFEDARHVIDWRWRDHRRLPWVLAVDWGTNDHHVALMCQVMEDGTWIIADELVQDGIPQGKFKKLLLPWIDERGTPTAAGTDRANPLLNQWLMSQLGARGCMVQSASSRFEQYVINSIELVRDQLDPPDGLPRLMIARSLIKPANTTTNGIYQALKSYRYQLDREGKPKRSPYKDDVNDHACDSLRYSLLTTRHRPDLHGGRTLMMTALGPGGDTDRDGKNRPHY